MNKLHILPNGDGIELGRVFAVHYLVSLGAEYKPKVKVEYVTGGTAQTTAGGFGCQTTAGTSWVSFDTDEEAIKFRDEFIKTINDARQTTWNADQLEAAPNGSGFGDWYQRYRVWNRDKTVVLLHTDVLKEAIEFLNKG